MNLYTCLTPSHAPLFDQHFKPSVDISGLALQPPRLLAAQQSSDYASEGFRAACVGKIEYLLEVLETETDPFVFSDVDIRFYGPVVEDLLTLLGDGDMAFQHDGPGGACTGFMVLRPSEKTKIWAHAMLATMLDQGLMDQDAAHRVLEGTDTWLLPERYWSVGQTGKHWLPGLRVNPPRGLLMHHANWTVGVGSKLLLLAEVKEQVEKGARASELVRCIPVPEAQKFAAQEVAKVKASHHPMPLAIVLQVWSGDLKRGLELARLLADIERERREDVLFVLAAQTNVPLAALADTVTYLGHKFRVLTMQTQVDERLRYPGIAYKPWSTAAAHLSKLYHNGTIPHHSAFFIESDGCPMAVNWIDRIKTAHAETLAVGKRITGPRMRYDLHVNGSLVMHLSVWEDRRSLHHCPPAAAWDIFHGHVFVSELGPSQEIANMYGMQSMSEPVWHGIANIAAWLTSVKDGAHQHWAKRNLVWGGKE